MKINRSVITCIYQETSRRATNVKEKTLTLLDHLVSSRYQISVCVLCIALSDVLLRHCIIIYSFCHRDDVSEFKFLLVSMMSLRIALFEIFECYLEDAL